MAVKGLRDDWERIFGQHALQATSLVVCGSFSEADGRLVHDELPSAQKKSELRFRDDVRTLERKFGQVATHTSGE